MSPAGFVVAFIVRFRGIIRNQHVFFWGGWESPTYGVLLCYCWKGLALVSLFMSTLQFAFTVYSFTHKSTKKYLEKVEG